MVVKITRQYVHSVWLFVSSTKTHFTKIKATIFTLCTALRRSFYCFIRCNSRMIYRVFSKSLKGDYYVILISIKSIVNERPIIFQKSFQDSFDKFVNFIAGYSISEPRVRNLQSQLNSLNTSTYILCDFDQFFPFSNS